MSLIREDTASKHVFCLPTSYFEFCDTTEHLIFDYSLTEGDTVNSCIYDFIGASSITEVTGGGIDSIGVMELYGKERTTLFTTGFLPYGQDLYVQRIYIAEGIGLEMAGILFHPLSVLIDFCEGEMYPCQLISSFRDIDNPESISISPNPTKDHCQISLSEEEIMSIRLFTTTGNLLYSNKNNNRIDLSGLNTGIYLIEIVTEQGSRIVKRVIKEN